MNYKNNNLDNINRRAFIGKAALLGAVSVPLASVSSSSQAIGADDGGYSDVKTYNNLVEALNGSEGLGSFLRTTEYVAGSGVGGATYQVSSDPGFNLINPKKMDGSHNYLKLVYEGAFNLYHSGATEFTDSTENIAEALEYIADLEIIDGKYGTFVVSDLAITKQCHIHNITFMPTGSIELGRTNGTYLTDISYLNVKIDGVNSISSGVIQNKFLRCNFTNFVVENFNKINDTAIVFKGTTSCRFFNCTFQNSYNLWALTTYYNASNQSYVPSNENKFFGCNFIGSSSGNNGYSGAILSPEEGVLAANNNALIGCWFESDVSDSIQLRLETHVMLTVSGCRFEKGYIAVDYIDDNKFGNIIGSDLFTGNNFTGLKSDIAFIQVDGLKNQFRSIANYWDLSGGIKAINLINGGTKSTLNERTAGADLFGVLSDDIDYAGSINTPSVTTESIKLTDRKNGNGWVEYVLNSSSIEWMGESLIEIDTEGAISSDILSNIAGGSNGDVIKVKAKDNSRTIIIPKSTGTIRVPYGGLVLDNIFKVATFINDGYGRWLLDGFGDNK